MLFPAVSSETPNTQQCKPLLDSLRLTSISRDSKVKLGLIAFIAFASAISSWMVGVHLPFSELHPLLCILACITPLAIFYHIRKADQFTAMLLALMHEFSFTVLFTVLMYSVAKFSMPYADHYLASCDAMLGVHVPDIVQWTANHPRCQAVLNIAYDSLIPQIFLLILAFGFLGDQRPLQQFILRLMLGLLITVTIFSVIPAQGPFAYYGFEMLETQRNYLEHLVTLRSGERTLLVLYQSEGLITVPSFHTTGAILLTAAVWHRRLLFVPICLLNIAMIIATMATGWHYVTDVIAGILVAIFVIILTNRLEPWLTRTAPSRIIAKEATAK